MMTFLRRAAANERGASAVEFALILPFLFLLHIGSAEALQAYTAHRNLSHVAATMADITARSRTVSTAELNDILVASGSVMYPFSTQLLQQRISSLSANSSGSVSVDSTIGKDFTDGSAPSSPAGFLLSNESVIITDVIMPGFSGINVIEELRAVLRRAAHVEAAAVDRVAAPEIDADRDDEHDQQRADDRRGAARHLLDKNGAPDQQRPPAISPRPLRAGQSPTSFWPEPDSGRPAPATGLA